MCNATALKDTPRIRAVAHNAEGNTCSVDIIDYLFRLGPEDIACGMLLTGRLLKVHL